MTKHLDSLLAPLGIEASPLKLSDIRIDSRKVAKSDLFVAIEGVSQNGVKFIDSAIENGAAAILVDSSVTIEPKQVPVYSIDNLSDALPSLLGSFYQKNENRMLVGITGTNGKTTVSQLIAQIGELLQQKVAVVGTLGAGRLGQLIDMNNTTPGIADNYRLLEQFDSQGCDFVAMEVSSQGLAQHRVKGIAFDACVFTNLTQDHLDYHGTLADYAQAKKTLFNDNPDAVTVINVDDTTGTRWLEQWRAKPNVIAVGQFNAEYESLTHVMFDAVKYKADGLHFTVKSSFGQTSVKCSLYGRFNLHNLVSAMAVYLSQGVSLKSLVSVIAKLTAVPGRMEKFGECEVIAIVDYAHTPDALSQALQAVKAHVSGRLWCIFGCGGDRDKGKRPLMAKMAERYADKIVVTNDNPRNEVPQNIVEDILRGIEQKAQVKVELDRKKAISDTLAQANRGDIVLIAGKGHETYQVFGDEVVDYDERSFVRQYFTQNIEELAHD